MKATSSIADRAVELRAQNGTDLVTSAIEAIKERGYSNPNQSVGVSLGFSKEEKDMYSGKTILKAVMSELGKRGGLAPHKRRVHSVKSAPVRMNWLSVRRENQMSLAF